MSCSALVTPPRPVIPMTMIFNSGTASDKSMCILLVVEGRMFSDKNLFHNPDLFVNFSSAASVRVINRKYLIPDTRVS